MIGQRLRLARTGIGLSLRALEERIGNLVSAQAIGKYEREEMMPGSRVLIALAEALGVSESYLVGQSDIQLEDVACRKKALTSRQEAARVEAVVLDHLERYLAIEELLHVASVDWDEPAEAPFPVYELADAERAAQALRAHWELGLDPIPSLTEFLEERGIKVLLLALPPTVSGLTCWVRRKDRRRVPAIVVNTHDTGERQRFTLAHEVGHMIQDVGGRVEAEKVAHRFAGAFLMPAEVLWAEIGKHRSALSLGELFALKRRFSVSVQAITYRCKDLHILSEATAGRLFQEFARRGWRSPPYPEPDPVREPAPQRFKRLCFRALAEGALSEAKAAELLGLSVRQLTRDMDEPPAGEA